MALSMLTPVQMNDPDDDRELKRSQSCTVVEHATASRVSITILIQQKTFVRFGKLATREIH